MPRLFQHHRPVIRQLGQGGFHFRRQIRLCKIQVQLGTHMVIFDEYIRISTAFCTQIGDDPLDLLLFLAFQKPDIVVCLHNSNWLNKIGLPSGGSIVDQPLYIPPMLCLHRQYISAVPEGHDGLLQVLLHGCGTDHFIQGIPQLLTGLGDLPADGRQSGASSIGDLLLRQNGTLQLVPQCRIGRQPGKQICQRGLAVLAVTVPVIQALDLVQQPCNAQQFP